MVEAMGSSKTISAIGNFDGVHLGHKHLLAQTADFAKAHGAAPGVVVFDPHPRQYFRPDDPPFLLTSPAQRDLFLRKCGVVEVHAVPFDAALAAMTPEAFINDVLKDRLGLAGIVAGAEFRFGADRSGDADGLKSIGEAAGLKVLIADVLSENPGAEKFGSRAVREALRKGALDRVGAMLGRVWSVNGVVTEGRKVGRTIGFPTANLTLGPLVEPRQGVYATLTIVEGKLYGSVSNFGRRPTVGSDAPLLETYLFNFEGDLYGREIEVAFIEFLRDEKKFDGLGPLKAQIAEDCERAQQILAAL